MRGLLLPATLWLLLGGRAAAEPSCRTDGWCWVNPAPQGNDLWDVWASGPTDGWAVGDHGTLLHWDGRQWTLADSGVAERLRAIGGSGPRDVWAVGDLGAAIHFDGRRWEAHPLPKRPALLDVWVSPTGRAWTVGGDTLARWDGAAWQLEPAAGAKTVWGSGDGDVWVGGGPTLRRWDGARWSPVPLPEFPKAQSQLRSGVTRLRGAGADQVLAIFTAEDGDGAEALDVYDWDGHAWSRLPAHFRAPGGVWQLDDLWVPQRDRAWFRLDFSRAPVPPFHLGREGDRWVKLADEAKGLDAMNPVRLGGAADADGWAVGGCGGLAHWNGHDWRPASTNPAVMASPMPDPDVVHWQSLGSPHREGHELWLAGRWPFDERGGRPAWFRVDLDRRTLAPAKVRAGAFLQGTRRHAFQNGSGDGWRLRDVGSAPHAATIVTHTIGGRVQPPVAFPRLRGGYVDAQGAFWAWGDCGTVVTQAPGSRAAVGPR